MNIKKEEISPVELRLTVTIDDADYVEDINKKLKEIGRTQTIPGFRKGHVPAGELKRRFGKLVASDVVNDLVAGAINQYIDDNKLPIIGYPMPVEVKEVALNGEQTFAFEVGLLPIIDGIKPTSDDHYPFYEIEVTDEMIDQHDKDLRKRLGKQGPGEEMTEDGIVKGTLMQLNADGTVNTAEGAIQVNDGIVYPLYFKDADQRALFDGKKPGDKVVFNPSKASGGDAGELASMLHIDKAIAGDVNNDFEMAISEIIVNTPAELGQEYYDNLFGADKVHNEEEYRAALKTEIARELSQNSHILFRNMFDDAMLEKYGKEMLLPADIIKKQILRNEENPEEAYEKSLEGIKREMIEANLTKALEIEVAEADLLDMAKALTARQFAQYGMGGIDEEIITKYAKEQLGKREVRQQMYQNVLTNKLYNAIEAAVTLDKKTVSMEDFRKLAEKA